MEVRVVTLAIGVWKSELIFFFFASFYLFISNWQINALHYCVNSEQRPKKCK